MQIHGALFFLIINKYNNMKTEKELNNDILNITMKIEAKHPELSKFIGEMPVRAFDTGTEVDLKSLEDYYNSLSAWLKNYDVSHNDEQ
jgi:hypothetical protein